MPLAKIKQLSAQIKTGLQNRNTTQTSHIVALDVGTEYVKALIGRFNDDSIEIIGVGRKHQHLSDMHSGAIADISAVVANCDEALTEAEAQARVNVRQAVIGIAGELVQGTTNTIRYKRPEPDKEITIEEMEHILNRVQKRAYEQARNQVAWQTGNQDIDVKLINSAIVAIHIDAYKVSNPIGFKGKDVAIQIYTAFAPMIHIGALERTANDLDLDLIAVAAEPFAVTRAVIGTDSTSNLSAITIDVGGGTTDIAVVNEGGVEGTKMFGIGGRAFTRTIASELDVDFEEAEQIKLSYSDDQIEPDLHPQVQAAVEKTLDVWLDGVALALGDFDTVDQMPNQMLLCGGGASMGGLLSALQERNWYKELPFPNKPQVRLIEPKQVVGVVDTTGKVDDHTYITAMGLLRVGQDTLGNGSKLGSVRDKLDKLLKI